MNRLKRYWKYLVDSFSLEDDMDDVCEFCDGKGTVVNDYGDDKEEVGCPECSEEDFTGATNQER